MKMPNTYAGCRWVVLKKLPAGVVDAQELPWGDLPPGMTSMSTYDERVGMLFEAIVKDVVLQGEDAADAVAISMTCEKAFAEHNGVLYAMIDSPDYAQIYKFVCGIRSALPWMLTLGALGGVGGFALGDKVGGPPGLVIALGALAGALGGYGIQYVAKR